MIQRNAWLAVAVGLSLLAGTGRAATLTLSGLSSDATDPALLNAALDFAVTGTTLVLTVTNNTAAPNAYQISEIYFNVSDDVAGLSLITPSSGWTLNADDSADGFGRFDFAIIGDKGIPRTGVQTILPGESQVFELNITPAAGAAVIDLDFVTELSSTPPGDRPSLAAAKFVRGPDEDSAFGATTTGAPPVIPAPLGLPAGLSLLACLGCGSARRWRVA